MSVSVVEISCPDCGRPVLRDGGLLTERRDYGGAKAFVKFVPHVCSSSSRAELEEPLPHWHNVT